MRSRSLFQLLTLIGLAALVLTACGGSSKKKSSSSSSGNSGGTLVTVAKAAPSGSPDPQIDYTLQEWQLLILSHDGLVGFKRAAGTEGTKIVPDLATGWNWSEDGKELSFPLRQGVKWHDGKTFTAQDVKCTWDLLSGKASEKLRINPRKSWYSNVEEGVIVDDASGKVTFHLSKPDPEFLDQLGVPFAFILPTGTPNTEVKIPPPGTGPYKWTEYNPSKEMKLVRNTNFKEWSKDAQPDGNPDTIVQKFGLSAEAQVTQVENGDADWMFDTPPADRLSEMSTKHADQVHINPLTAVYYFAFGVTVPPFNNLKARQAVNLATDRNALVKIYGGPKLAVPTCQILPPNFPGYKPYCPYTKNPGEKWTAPDLAKAKQLVAQSGTKGASVKVNTDTTDTNKALGLYFVDLLNSLGYKAQLQALAPDIQYPFCQNSKNKIQFCYSSWYQDYPAASDFLDILLGCDSIHPNSDSSPNIAQFCDKPIQGKMDQAAVQASTDPATSNATWAGVDKAVTDQAPWVSMFNPKYIDFLSTRVKGYQFSPQWYFLLAQASVK